MAPRPRPPPPRPPPLPPPYLLLFVVSPPRAPPGPPPPPHTAFVVRGALREAHNHPRRQRLTPRRGIAS
ncbi:hypothetical protein [Nocardia asiatica]|uniref:hypothetical protein n=1 Tax=Nocardia asiatica TaxID=209252 RepID=UPI002453A893|nr:hypothetical protein [Nocardia asiatica]